jgi:FkbM family methyltransferase
MQPSEAAPASSEPAPTAPPASAAPPARPAFSRRSFFTGAVAGAIVGKGSEWVQPLEWTLKGMPHGTQLSFAQCGEDLVASGLFEYLGISTPTYLDIGAYEPILGSNTYLFYRRGARGVLVEPNVDCVPKLRSKRPHDTVLNVGIGITADRAADFYRLTSPQLNTFDKAEAERVVRESAGKVILREVVKMPLVPINDVIAEHFGGRAPDFLSIDVEGLDYPILKTLDFTKYRPKVICTELQPHGEPNEEAIAFVKSKDYVIRGMTSPNIFFRDRHAKKA